jgi:uncharacterized membrane protein YqgA involved in biofilm formation
MMGVGTAINVVAVLVGAGVGTLVGARLSEGMRETAMYAIGLVTLLVGIQSFLRFDNPLVPLVSVILGLVVGERLGIDGRLKRFGDALEGRFSKGGSPVSRAFVTTSLLFCVGPLTILGSCRTGSRATTTSSPSRARWTSSLRFLSPRCSGGECFSRLDPYSGYRGA